MSELWKLHANSNDKGNFWWDIVNNMFHFLYFDHKIYIIKISQSCTILVSPTIFLGGLRIGICYCPFWKRKRSRYVPVVLSYISGVKWERHKINHSSPTSWELSRPQRNNFTLQGLFSQIWSAPTSQHTKKNCQKYSSVNYSGYFNLHNVLIILHSVRFILLSVLYSQCSELCII